MAHEDEMPKGYIKLSRPLFKPYNSNYTSHEKKFDIKTIDEKFYGRILGRIRFLKPVSFTQNHLTEHLGQPALRLHREGKKVVLPGSSLKGTLRSYAELLSNSHEQYDCKYSNNLGDKPALCITCATFGAMHYLGRIQFNDVKFDSKEAAPKFVLSSRQWNGNGSGSKVKVYSNTNHEWIKKELYYETIPEGNETEFEILINGMDTKEMGLLFLAMGLHAQYNFYPKLGRGKNLDFGTAKFIIDRLVKTETALSMKMTQRSGDKLNNYIQEAIRQYLDFVRDQNSKDIIMSNLEILKRDSAKLEG